MFARPRMMALKFAPQMVQSHVRINLRSRDIGVAENRLHGAQIRSVFHHVSGATMAQHVRAGMAAGSARSALHHLPDTLSR